jgi:hypothetical protein
MIDLELKSLEHFIGTQNYYNVMGVNVTDGIKYIMDNGYSWFVTDAVAVIKAHKGVKKYLAEDDFLCIQLKVNKEEMKAKMVIDNGDGKVLYTQKYDFTDAKRDLKLFYTGNVLMLASEY